MFVRWKRSSEESAGTRRAAQPLYHARPACPGNRTICKPLATLDRSQTAPDGSAAEDGPAITAGPAPGPPCALRSCIAAGESASAVMLTSFWFGEGVRFAGQHGPPGQGRAGKGGYADELGGGSGERDGCGRRPGAWAGGGPDRAVGLAAWQADGDLVRAGARLNLLYVPAASPYFPFYVRGCTWVIAETKGFNAPNKASRKYGHYAEPRSCSQICASGT